MKTSTRLLCPLSSKIVEYAMKDKMKLSKILLRVEEVEIFLCAVFVGR